MTASRIKFLQEHEVPHAPGDTVFRQGLWRNSIACAVSTALAAACLLSPSLAPYFGWEMDELVFFAYVIGALVGLLAWFTWRALRMSLAPTNWVMRLAPNGIYLRYRSYLNGDFPDQPVAAFVPGGLVEWIRPVVEKSSRIDSEGSRQSVTHRRLEIKLRQAAGEEFKQQLAHERQRRIPTRFGSKGVFRHYPVRLAGEDVIQIDWRDTQTVTVPGLTAAAAILARRFPDRDAEHRHRPDPAGQNRRDQEAEILSLAEAGEVIQAVKLTKHLYGLSTTDAKVFVDDLTA